MALRNGGAKKPIRQIAAKHARLVKYKTRRRIRRARQTLSKLFQRQKKRQEDLASRLEPTPSNMRLLALEPRIVFDAAAGATAEQAADHVAEQQAAAAVAEASPEPNGVSNELAQLDAVLPQTSARVEIAFVDMGVENVDQLIAQLGDSVEIVTLDSNSDGVEQIASVLEGRENIDAIHILSHGQSGRLVLGNDVLDSNSMQGEHLDELTTIGQSLSAEGDILIYGCDFTAGDAGLEAAMLLGGITGADIAASHDITGHESRGGDWELETTIGEVETDSLEAEDWVGNLVATTTTLTYDAAASAAAGTVNGQPTIVLTDGELTVTVTNNLGAGITGPDVNFDSASGTAESVQISATTSLGPVDITRINFAALNNFDPNNYVDAIALDQTGTWSNLGRNGGPEALTAYSNDAAGEAAASADTGETVSFATLQSEGAVSDVLLNPVHTAEDGYFADFTFDAPVDSFLLFGSDVVPQLNQVTSMNFSTMVITYDASDVDGDGVADTADIDADNDGILDVDEGLGSNTTITAPQVNIAASGGSSTDTIDLTALGVSIGDTVTVSNVLADGDLNGGTETFTLDFNSGEFTTGGLQTGLQNIGSLVEVTAPLAQAITVIDIGGGVPGIQITAQADPSVNTLSGSPALSYTVDVNYTVAARDTDGDGIADYLDLDSDNDGITDNVEAQSSAGYVAPSNNDADGDGLDDAYDATPTTGAAGSLGLTPVDTDGDGTADYRDEDSDDDGVDDIIERGDGQPTTITSTADADRDGLLDIFEGGNINDGYDVNDENLTGTTFNLADTDQDTAANGSNAAPLLTDFDYRDNSAAPIAVNDSGTTAEDVTLNVPAASGLLSNDIDPDGPTATVTQFVVGGSTFAAGSTASLAEGDLTINADGSYTFAPVANYNGPVPSATYTVTDGTATDTAVLTIAVTPVNDGPVATGESDTTAEDVTLNVGAASGVLTNDTDLDGDTLSVTQFVVGGSTFAAGSTASLAEGDLTINADGSYTFAPAANYNGPVPAATYTVTDGVGDGYGGADDRCDAG